MLRINQDGSIVVWFQLTTEPRYKIQWPLDEFIRHARDSVNSTGFRANSLSGESATISMLTQKDIEELLMTKSNERIIRQELVKAATQNSGAATLGSVKVR